jgi:hypothetical protein
MKWLAFSLGTYFFPSIEDVALETPASSEKHVVFEGQMMRLINALSFETTEAAS